MADGNELLESSLPRSWQQEIRERVAQAADVCLKPQRHAVRFSTEPAASAVDWSDCSVLIEPRDPDGTRRADLDLELEIYRSGADLNLMLARVCDPQAPLLWQGSHPVWMQADSGQRCDRPADGAALEAFCRRLRALLTTVSPEAPGSAGWNDASEP